MNAYHILSFNPIFFIGPQESPTQEVVKYYLQTYVRYVLDIFGRYVSNMCGGYVSNTCSRYVSNIYARYVPNICARYICQIYIFQGVSIMIVNLALKPPLILLRREQRL